MAERVLSETWSPPWAQHVVGKYEPERFDDGKREPQMVEATCSVCKQTMRRPCDSGRVRAHIATFAQLHLHRDPLSGIPRQKR